jgi:hypothetical protein
MRSRDNGEDVGNRRIQAMRYHGTRPLMKRMQAIDQALRAQRWPTDKTLGKRRCAPVLSCSVAKSELKESALTPGGLLNRRHSRTN